MRWEIAGLPSLWHQPRFVREAIQSPLPEIPIQPVARETGPYQLGG